MIDFLLGLFVCLSVCLPARPPANILFPNDIAIAPPTMTYSAPWLLLAVNQFLDASSARRCLGDSAGGQRTFIMKFSQVTRGRPIIIMSAIVTS